MTHSESIRRLQTASKCISLFYTGIVLLFLLANMATLYILVGTPKAPTGDELSHYEGDPDDSDHDIIAEDINSNSKSSNNNCCTSLATILSTLSRDQQLSLKRADLVTIFTITLLYLILELFTARILYHGVQKLQISKLQFWCDVRLTILLVNALAMCSNFFNWTEERNYAIVNIFLIALTFLGFMIVKKLMAVIEEFQLYNFPNADPLPAKKQKLPVDAFVSEMI